uniref:Uncharacterized protein n=1 Tax=Octopus bimaculoides TaxID=37653 RepID=A0A0L8HRF9_OCTBM
MPYLVHNSLQSCNAMSNLVIFLYAVLASHLKSFHCKFILSASDEYFIRVET